MINVNQKLLLERFKLCLVGGVFFTMATLRKTRTIFRNIYRH